MAQVRAKIYSPENEENSITWQLKKLKEVLPKAKNPYALSNKIKKLEKRLKEIEFEKHLAR